MLVIREESKAMSKILAFGLGAAVFICFATPDLTWAQIANCRAASVSFDIRMEREIGTLG